MEPRRRFRRYPLRRPPPPPAEPPVRETYEEVVVEEYGDMPPPPPPAAPYPRGPEPPWLRAVWFWLAVLGVVVVVVVALVLATRSDRANDRGATAVPALRA